MSLSKTKLINSIELFSWIFIASAVPLLLTGRAALAISLGLALILTLTQRNLRELFLSALHIIPKPIYIVGLICCIMFLVTVTQSLNVDRSLSTFVRTPLIPLLTFVLIFAHRENINKISLGLCIGILISSSIGVFSFLFWPELIAIVKFKDKMSYLQIYTSLKPIMNAFVLTIPIIFILLWNRNIYIKLFASLAIGMIVYGTFISHSKAAMVALLAMVSLPTILYLIKLKSKKVLLLCAFICILLTLGISNWLQGLSHLDSNINSEFRFAPLWLLDFHRQSIWQYSIDKSLLSPLFGYGINASNFLPDSTMSLKEYFGENYQPILSGSTVQIFPGHPHNWAIEIILETGLLGFIPFIIFVGLIFWINIRSYLKTQNLILLAILGINSAYWGSGLFNFSYWSGWWQSTYYLTVFIGIVTYLQQKQENCHI